ncbi:MAG: GNAT family N-acetyltransferase [Opitutales bacterium]
MGTAERKPVPDLPGVTVRPATQADIPFLAEILLIATRGDGQAEEDIWTAMLEGIDTAPIDLAKQFLVHRALRWGTPEEFILLEREGAPAAACSLLNLDPYEPDPRPVRLEKVPALARDLGWDEAATARFKAGYDSLWHGDRLDWLRPQAPCILELVGVLPDYRGQGLGRCLMEQAFVEAACRGYASIGLMVLIGNEPAMRLYAAVGFQPAITYHAAYFGMEFPGVIKYTRPLDPA